MGDGLGGMQAAADLAAQAFPTILLSIDNLSKEITQPSDRISVPFRTLKQRLRSEMVKNGAMIYSGTKLLSINGIPGSYRAAVTENGKSRILTVGAIILDLNAGLDGEIKTIIGENNRQTDAQPSLEPAVSRLPGVFLCGTGQETDVDRALTQGSAAACKASIFLSKGTLDIEETAVTVDRQRCRGCGICSSICPFEAITPGENINGIWAAEVNEGLCRGCGICIARCPSGALSLSNYSDNQVTASLEAILA